MTNNCLHPNCFHLDHVIGKDLIIEILNSIVNWLNSLNTCLELFALCEDDALSPSFFSSMISIGIISSKLGVFFQVCIKVLNCS